MARTLGAVNVLFASQTGNLQTYAQRFASELHWRLGIHAVTGAVDDFGVDSYVKLPPSATAFFFVSSYGSGMPAHNGRRFWDTLIEPTTNEAPNPGLKFQYGVFGRGNRIYTRLNRAARFLDDQLANIGAHRICPYGEQDAKASVRECEDEYVAWKETAIALLGRQLGINERKYEFLPFHYHVHTPPSATMQFPLATLDVPNPSLRPTSAKVLAHTDRLFVHAETELNHPYKPGDHLLIWPVNSAEEVAILLRAIGQPDSLEFEINGQWTASLGELARRHLDINGPVPRELVGYIAEYAPTESARTKAWELYTSPQKFNVQSQIDFNLGRLLLGLSDGEPWHLPPGFLLDNLGPLYPRSYSISSSPNDPTASICSVVEKHGEFSGVATSYLADVARLSPATVDTAVAVRDTGFHLPDDPEAPLLMIGLGTGVAPYRGFVRERAHLGSKAPMLLFAGARTSEDVVYRDEFRATPNLELVECLTREPGLPRTHVSDAIHRPKYAAQIVDMLVNKNGNMYICGSREKVLGQEPRKAVVEVLSRAMDIPFKEAANFVKQLKKDGRLKTDMY